VVSLGEEELFGNKVLKKLFRLRVDKVRRTGRQFERSNFKSSPNIAGITKPRKFL
jgi:hypothetical protein